jgi:hypothetical protein
LNIKRQLAALVEGFAVFNPHSAITLDWFGTKTAWAATNPNWSKWRPDQPTSAHWYHQPHIERLIGAYIAAGRADRLVSDFLSEFDGLSGSAKQTKILAAADLKRARLSDLIKEDQFDHERIARLLAAMQGHTRPVASKRLGLIGEPHLRQRLLEMGVQPESFRYKSELAKSKKPRSETDDKASFLPWVIEAAFGWLGSGAKDERKIVTGANWSAAIKNQ